VLCIPQTTDTHSKETTNLPSLLAFPAPVGTGDRPTAAASKLKVGPGLLETAYKSGMKRVFGNHWVVAAGAFVTLSGMLVSVLQFEGAKLTPLFVFRCVGWVRRSAGRVPEGASWCVTWVG
jgi:hypothetical protein